MLWERSGLTSYVLASPDQRFHTTYHYLKYALKTQSPKVVLIDTLMLTESNSTSSKEYDSKALYAIKDVRSRIEFSNDIFESYYTKSKALPQYYFDKFINLSKTVFPVFAFCSTFDFSSDYFKYYSEKINTTYNGSIPMYIRIDMSEESGYMTENCKGTVKIDPDADKYFKKLIDLCRDNDIKIILYKTVSPYYWSNEKYRAVADYAANLGLDYIDLNVDPSSFGFDLSKHMYERWKVNADGMRLTTELLSDFITKTCPELSDSEKSETVKTYYDSLLDRYNHEYENAKWEIM
ncbi:MAG: hypothetical protein K5756_05090 [Clostridiales bacterium]|nr:hypothetical protein [Clostridiales bacterium]